MDKELKEIIKNNSNFLRLSKNIQHIGHAHLVVSSDSMFRSLFCKELIKEILAKNNREDLAEKVEHGVFVDISEINGTDSIKVSDIQPIIDKSGETGIESDFKFYIISNAENLTIEAQNKLLKTLEERNKSQYYFLCTPSRFLLLSTIVSRCNIIELSQSSKESIGQYLIENGQNSIEAKESAELSLGSYQNATNKTNAESFMLAINALTQINGSSNAAEYAALLQKCNLQQVVQYLEFLLLDAIKLKHDLNDIWFESYRDRLIKLKTCSILGLLFIHKQIQNIKELQKVNVSQVVLADKIALSIAEGKNKK